MTPPLLKLALNAVLVLNMMWFGAGANYFGVKAESAAKLLVPPHARQSPLFATVSAAVRFLGGMNLAFAVLACVLLFNQALFADAKQTALLVAVIALAHGTQFAANVPLALREGSPDSPWPVLRGLMLFIFVVDFSLMLANGALAVGFYAA